MATDTKTRELVELEKRFWDAMKRKDGAAAARLTAKDSIVTGPQGVSTIGPEMMSQLTVEGQWTIDEYDLDESSLKVRMLDEDVAVVAYRVKERLQVEGEKVELEASDSSVWVREDGEWKCALHTESLSGDPFGRDRKRN